MEWYEPVGVGVVIIAVIVVLAYLYERKRNEKLKVFAAMRGFNFYPKGEDTLLTRLSNLSLFSQGRSRKIKNLADRREDKLEISYFDYQYTTGGGQHSSTSRQTVICFRSESLRLSSFSLRPENIFHKIGSTFGYQDIDFDASPVFSSQYLLRGKDEQAIRRAFNAGVLAFYERHKGVCTEGEGDQLIYYRPAKRVKPEELSNFLDEGMNVFELFRSA